LLDYGEWTIVLAKSGSYYLTNGEDSYLFTDVVTAKKKGYVLNEGKSGSYFALAEGLTIENGRVIRVVNGWRFDSVKITHLGGVYYATYAFEKTEGIGVQTVDVQIDVQKKIVDTTKLSYVNEKTSVGNRLDIRSLETITANVGEYFDLPRRLWVTFKDGSSAEYIVDWKCVSDGDVTKDAGTYLFRAVVFEQEIETKVILTDNAVVTDTFIDTLVVKRGEPFTLPSTIEQTVSGRTKSYSITWRTVPSYTMAGSYLLIGEISNGTVTWTKELMLYIYSDHVTSITQVMGSEALGTADGVLYATVKVGTILEPSDLPGVKVKLYNDDGNIVETGVNWYFVDENYKVIGTIGVNDLSKLDTSIAGKIYRLKGVIKNHDGGDVSYKGKTLYLTIVVEDNVSFTDSDLITYEESYEFDYKSTPRMEELILIKPTADIEISLIEYRSVDASGNEGDLLYRVDRTGISPIETGSFPEVPGKYRATVLLSGYGKTEQIKVDYTILPKEIYKEDILAIGTVQSTATDAPYLITCRTKDNTIELKATYVKESDGSAVIAPTEAGIYIATIYTDDPYCKVMEEIKVRLIVKGSVTVVFKKTDDSVLSQVKVGEGLFFADGAIPDPEVPAGQVFKGWYTVKNPTADAEAYDLALPMNDTGTLSLYAVLVDEVQVNFFDYNGTPYTPQTVGKGMVLDPENIPVPVAPEGKVFKGWFTSLTPEAEDEPYDLTKPVDESGPINLYEVFEETES